MSGITKKRLLEDVDGALIQIYQHPRGEIDVYNDEQLDEVYLRSEFDLRPYLDENGMKLYYQVVKIIEGYK